MKRNTRKNHLVAAIPQEVVDRSKTEFFYDTRTYTGSSDELEFFTANPTRNRLSNNYRSNPLEGNRRMLVTAVTLDPTLPVIKTISADNVDAADHVNLLLNASLEVNNRSGSVEQFMIPLERVFNIDGLKYRVKGQVPTDANGNATPTSYGIIGGTQEVPLPQAFWIDPNIGFDFKIHFAPGYTAIASADYSNQPTAFGFKAGLQVLIPPKGSF